MIQPVILRYGLIVGMSVALFPVKAAPPSAKMEFKGNITVPACTVSVSNQGVYDLGNISSSLIPKSGFYKLPTQSAVWMVDCSAETYLNMLASDNRADSVSQIDEQGTGDNFGLGAVNGDGKIVYFQVHMSEPMVDAKKVKLFKSKDRTVTWLKDWGRYLSHLYRVGWAESEGIQASGKVFSTIMEVNAWLANEQIMKGAISESTDIDGSVTVTFAFGL